MLGYLKDLVSLRAVEIRGHKVMKQVIVKVILLENSLLLNSILRPTEEARAVDTPASDCCAVCGFSEESGLIGIDVAVLPVSSDEIIWVECSKCEQRDHQLCEDVVPEEVSEKIDGVCSKY